MTLLAPSLQAFFTDRLMRQLQASGHTIRSYRATWRLLLLFAAAQTGKTASELDFADLSVPLITGFLDHLEHQRGNTVRTRNLRLAAIHSMLACAAPQHPEHADDIARVLAVPGKRFRTAIVTHLTEEEITALLQAPDPGTWTGRRDHALLLAAVTTGLRAGELAGLTRADTHLGDGPHLECHGKGRKDRVTPLLRDTAAVLAAWLGENPGGPGSPVFPTRRGTPMSQDAIEDCVKRHATAAALTCPSLTSKNVTPHVLRHSCAVRMLRSGIDIAVIALWMGHESTRTTMIYLKADLELKQRALDRTVPVDGEPGRKPPASIPSRALRKTSWTRPSATSRTTRPACATSGSASAACSPAPASSKPAASQSSASASSNPACTGPPTAQTPSSPCAAGGQQPVGSHLQHPAHSDTNRLTSPGAKMISVTWLTLGSVTCKFCLTGDREWLKP